MQNTKEFQASKLSIGICRTLSILTEFLVFYMSNSMMNSMGMQGLILLSHATLAFRYLLLAAITESKKKIYCFVCVCVFHKCSMF